MPENYDDARGFERFQDERWLAHGKVHETAGREIERRLSEMDELRRQIERLREAIEDLRRTVWIGCGGVIVLSFLLGTASEFFHH